MPPTINNASRNCATPTHGCAKCKSSPLSMGLLLVKAPFRLHTFNPSPTDHSINLHSLAIHSIYTASTQALYYSILA